MQVIPSDRLAESTSYKGWWIPGVIGATALVLLVGAPFVTLLGYADVQEIMTPLADPYLRRVIWFSFYQATLSTLLSIVLAVPVALALGRCYLFKGRAVLLNLFSVSLIIPTVVAIFGIVAIFGRTGWINQFAQVLGIDWQLSIYGLTGILIAHVFFNMPLAARIMLQSVESIPETSWRTSAQLGMTSWHNLKLLEWPAIRQQLAGLVVLIFSLCFTSFAIVMTLGGGPKATTIEVAIYQALRFDFDIQLAVNLAVIQFVICVSLMVLVTKGSSLSMMSLSKPMPVQRFTTPGRLLRVADPIIIALAFMFTLTPMIALCVSAINPATTRVLLSAQTLSATINTLLVGLCSGIVSVILGYLLLSTSRHLRIRLKLDNGGKLLESAGLTILVIPPVVLGTGLFLLLRPFADVFSLTLVLVILINAMMGLPFVLRILSVPMHHDLIKHDRLCLALGIRGLDRMRHIEWPTLRKPIGLSLALASTLSAGDLTVIALFGSERVTTLPLLLYQRMGSYRMYDAAATAMLLLIICVAIFWLLDRGVGGSHART